MIRFNRPNSLIVCGVALSGVVAAVLHAQTALPATSPTAITPSQLASANPAIPPKSADIQWDGHLLRITASGESLSQVFAQISALTGLRISGNVPGDRLYGSYGPAPLQDILSDLVSGLSVNMLFVDSVGMQPAKLNFTARLGGATPPDVQTGGQQSEAYSRPTVQPSAQTFGPAQQSSAAVPVNPGFANTSGSGSAAGQSPSTPQLTDTSGNPASPNGVKTPQEIFEQLRRLRANAGAQQ